MRGDSDGGAGAAICFLGSELRGTSRANVGLPVAEARQLCGLVGINQSGADDDGYVGSAEGGRRQGEARGGGSEPADAAGCFPGLELQARSRADVARKVAMTGDGDSGGLMVGERQQGGSVHGGSLSEVKAATCIQGPELRVESRADGSRSAAGTRQVCGLDSTDQLREDGKKKKRGTMGLAMAKDERRYVGMRWPEQGKLAPMTEADGRAALRGAAERDRKWEARWKAREAREKAAHARRRAEQDQGGEARPAQAGPGFCAACARQGGICGFDLQGAATARMLVRMLAWRQWLGLTAVADGGGRQW